MLELQSQHPKKLTDVTIFERYPTQQTIEQGSKLKEKSTMNFLLWITATLLIETSAFGVAPENPAVTRRNAMIAAPALIVATTTTAQSGANAAIDLSKYQDGPSGLKYLVTAPPTGSIKPERAQKVKTSYTLYLNGFPDDESSSKQIDSSKGLLGNKPFEFNVGVSQVIKGWDLSLMDMKVGEARRLVVPSELGYGSKGAGGRIPGGATLYFEVELTEIGQMPQLKPEQFKWLDEHPL